MPRKKKIAITGLLIALALFAASFVYFSHDKYNRMAITSNSGFMNNGEMFDVRIGMRMDEATVRILSHHFKPWIRENYEADSDQPNCLGHSFPKSFSAAYYFDDSWRRGSLCVIYSSQNLVT